MGTTPEHKRCAKARVSRRAFRQNDRVVCSCHFLDTAYALEGAFDVPFALWTRIQTRIQQFPYVSQAKP